CIRQRKVEYLGDGSRPPYGMPRATGGSAFQSVAAFPILYADRPIGVMEVYSTELRAFHKEQIALLESLADQVATALNNALMHQSVVFQYVIDVHSVIFNLFHFDDTLIK